MASSPPPLDAQAVLAWMQDHPHRLRELLAEEDPDGLDSAAAADSAVRAHLRLATEGLPAGLSPGLVGRVDGMADDLDAWFASDSDVLERQVELGRGAIALEEHLLYGADGGTEPAIHAALERRVRLGAWRMMWLRCLEARLGPEFDGLTESALQWTKDRERDLAATILHMHHRQLTAMQEATGHPATAEERDQSSQAAAVQGYVRQGIEAAAQAVAAI